MSDNRERALSDLPIFNNPAVSAAVNLQRRHPGEMVFLEVAAAGALLYQHHRSKSRQDQMRAEAEEELKKRGWDGGIKEHQRSQTGLLSPPPGQYPQRPTSAPPQGYVPQGFQGVAAQQRDDPLAYGSMPPPSQGYGAPRDDPMAYGSMPPQPQYQEQYGQPPEQYQQPYGLPPNQYQQQYGSMPGQYDQQYAQPPPEQWQQQYGPPQGQYQPQYPHPPPSAPPAYPPNYGPPGPQYQM